MADPSIPSASELLRRLGALGKRSASPPLADITVTPAPFVSSPQLAHPLVPPIASSSTPAVPSVSKSPLNPRALLGRLAELNSRGASVQPEVVEVSAVTSTRALSLDDIVRAWDPGLKRKPNFLENFPPVARPRLLTSLASIVEVHTPGLAAHDKRDDNIRKAVGSKMPAILKSFLEQNPFVKIKYPSLSADTLRHLMTAPHAGRRAAASYKNLLQIKLAKGQNDLDENLPLVPPPFLMSLACPFSELMLAFSFRVTSTMRI